MGPEGGLPLSPDDEARLSQLSTRWTLLVRAQQRDDPAAARDAQSKLLPRYCAAVYRYVHGVVRDAAAAEELCQEFAFRFVRGDFRHARPEKGRFRDYVKTALFHLVGEYRRKQQAGGKLLPFDSRVFVKTPIPDDLDAEFRESWKRELLNRTWAELKRACGDGPGPTLYDALRRKADDPASSSAHMAERIAAEFGRPVTAENVRQMIHRARVKFAELLRQEVGASLPSDDPVEIDGELAELGLLVYCS
jgi:DNA-directed RNA polymerase specialized sigma24 family protein